MTFQSGTVVKMENGVHCVSLMQVCNGCAIDEIKREREREINHSTDFLNVGLFLRMMRKYIFPPHLG